MIEDWRLLIEEHSPQRTQRGTKGKTKNVKEERTQRRNPESTRDRRARRMNHTEEEQDADRLPVADASLACASTAGTGAKVLHVVRNGSNRKRSFQYKPW
jgi:hypothetical protein